MADKQIRNKSTKSIKIENILIVYFLTIQNMDNLRWIFLSHFDHGKSEKA